MSISDQSTVEYERAPWALPEKYAKLSPKEQSVAVRAAILHYLRERGSAAKSAIAAAVGPVRPETIQRALDFLATTQQIYLDATSGSRDPTYHSNGRLAHASGQRVIDCIRFQYVIRSYDDRWAGKAITVTQYAVTPSGETRPLGGIRIDQEDMPELLRGIEQTIQALRQAQESFRSRQAFARNGEE